MSFEGWQVNNFTLEQGLFFQVKRKAKMEKNSE